MAKKQRVYPEEFLEILQNITNKRAKIVIDHILKNGFITTEELENTYGYNHPPRAARDVREAGIPLETFRVKSKDNKNIAAYRFGNLEEIQTKRIAGRAQFSKKFKHTLYEYCNSRCQICNGQFEERYLQVDHRVPYEVGGDTSERDFSHFLLLCGSCNRAKSWSCEHCRNWRSLKKTDVCMGCYWGNPSKYSHIAMDEVRRLDVQWDSDEIQYYDAVKLMAEQHNIEMPDFVKQILADRAGKLK